MKIDDIIAEIYQKKEEKLRKDFEAKQKEQENQIRKGQVFKDIKQKLNTLLTVMKNADLKISVGYNDSDSYEVKLEISKTIVEGAKKRVEKFESEFLKVKIALATTGKEDQKKLIEDFAKATF